MAPSAPEALGLLNPVVLLFRFDHPYLMGIENLVAPAL
jgi:hypothetical protein